MASELEWRPPVAEQFLIEGEQKEEKGSLRNFCQTLFNKNRLLKSSEFQAVFENNNFKHQSKSI